MNVSHYDRLCVELTMFLVGGKVQALPQHHCVAQMVQCESATRCGPHSRQPLRAVWITTQCWFLIAGAADRLSCLRAKPWPDIIKGASQTSLRSAHIVCPKCVLSLLPIPNLPSRPSLSPLRSAPPSLSFPYVAPLDTLQ
jgi:hypothetical protein